MASLKGTPFRTPLWCEADRHALKRDSKRTPYLAWRRHLDDHGRFLGVDTECLACEANVPMEPDSPIALELITGIEPASRAN